MRSWWYVVEINILYVLFLFVMGIISYVNDSNSDYLILSIIFTVFGVVVSYLTYKKYALAKIALSIYIFYNGINLIYIFFSKEEAITTSIYMLALGIFFVVGSIRLVTLRKQQIIESSDDIL